MSSMSDVLPTSVPHLELSGANWAEFVMRFWTAIRGKGIWGHFDGSMPCPVLEMLSLSGGTTPSISSVKPAAASTKGVNNEEITLIGRPSLKGKAPNTQFRNTVYTTNASKVREWERNENLSRALLVQRLPTTMAFIVDEMDTVKEMWEAVMKDFTYRGAYCQTRLRREFMATHCPKNGDVKLFPQPQYFNS